MISDKSMFRICIIAAAAGIIAIYTVGFSSEPLKVHIDDINGEMAWKRAAI